MNFFLALLNSSTQDFDVKPGMDFAMQCSMNRKAWAAAAVAGAIMLSALLVVFAGDAMTSGVDPAGVGRIAKLLAIGNALTIIP